ncbi:MAG: ABC transporter permease [Silvibacterium sp.]
MPIFRRISNLFSRSRIERDIDAELHAHIEMRVEDNIARGMPEEEARREARLRFGNPAAMRESTLDVDTALGIEGFRRDIKYAARQLRKSPSFTLTAVLMLALGIGATTAIFSIVEGVLLRPLPFLNPGRLVTVGDLLEGSHCRFCTQSRATAPDIRNFMRYTHSFTHLGGYQGTGFELSSAGTPARIFATRMSGDLFSTLGVAPLVGRAFTQQEDEQHEQVAVLSYDLWQSRFHGDAGVVGRKILLNYKPYVVVGVMPRGFEFPLEPGHLYQTEVWVPLSLQPEEFTGGQAASWDFRMVGRLKPGVTVAQAQSDADRVAQETMLSYPAFMRSLRIRALVMPLREDTVAQARPLIHILFLAVLVVLLICCANLAGLLLVRAIRSSREIAVRLALGARTVALLRQAVIESLLLSLAGGLLGLALAAATLHTGVRLLPETLPRISDIGLNWLVVGFALGLALLTGILCGLAPAFAAVRTSVNEALKAGGRTGTSSSGHARLRSALVIAEIAVALVLLTASGLLLRSFEKMRAVDVGFRPDHTLAAIYDLPKERYGTQTAIDEFNDTLLRDAQQLPGVEAVGITSLVPAAGDGLGIALTIDGYVPPKGAGLNMAAPSLVEGDPFGALGIRLLRGRTFTDADKAGSPLVVIVNRKLAEQYWPGQDPIGKRLRRGMQETATPWMTVVGEVESVKLGSPDGRTAPEIYQPATQTVTSEGVFATAGELDANSGYIILRSSMPPEQMENMLREMARKIDPQLPVFRMRTMDEVIAESEASRRFNTTVISSFGLISVLLGVLGIYSVIAFSVASREQEMALRMALGSQRWGIVRLVLSSGTKLAAVGCVLGLIGAAAVSQVLRSFLFGVSPFDPAVLAVSVAAMLVLAIMASALPAARAAKTNPMTALRGE